MKRGREGEGERGREGERDEFYDCYVERSERRREIVMRLLVAYNESANGPKIETENLSTFNLLYLRETDTMLQERQTGGILEKVNLEHKLAIGRNIRILHEIIDCGQHDTATERVKDIFQDIATRINDTANPAKRPAFEQREGGAKRNNRKRNSSKRANKKKKTIKSKSKRRLRTRKY